jgi:hypothetical protein
MPTQMSSPFAQPMDWLVTDEDPGYFGPEGAPGLDWSALPALTVQLNMSRPMEVEPALSPNSKYPLQLGWAPSLPAEAGVYRFDCMTWMTAASDVWIELDWSYVGEGKSVRGRLDQYAKASRVVRANGGPSAQSHSQKMAHRIMQSIAPRQVPAGVVVTRLFPSW